MDKILVLNKERNMTSFQAVSRVKRFFDEKKAGHTGTLDPNATGVLPVMLGKCTRLAPFITDSEKEYIAKIKFGIKTDTLDIWGEIIDKADCSFVTEDKLKKALERFVGEIEQTPPMYSAIRKDGVRLYELARKNIEIERESRKIRIYSIDLLSFDNEKKEAEIKVLCGKGTYIRSLVDDIGRALGTFAVMTELERTKNCGFSIEEAVSLRELEEIEDFECVLISPERFLSKFPRLEIFGFGARLLKNGQKIRLGKYFGDAPEGYIRLYEKDFLGLGIIEKENNEKYLKAYLLF